MFKRPPPKGGSLRYLAGMAIAGASCLALYGAFSRARASGPLVAVQPRGGGMPAAAASRAPTMGVSYWIELVRNGKTYRCDDTFTFRCHDAIRFHVFANENGYVYLVLRTGS